MSVSDLFAGNIIWLPVRKTDRGDMVFADTLDELITLAAQSGGISLDTWDPVAVIGAGAYDKGAPHPLAAKVNGKWEYYNEMSGPFVTRVRGRVKFVKVTREVVADSVFQDELPF